MAGINLLDQSIAQCCRSDWLPYNLTESKSDIVSIFNASHLKSDRQTMLTGEVPVSCNTCVEYERKDIVIQNQLLDSRKNIVHSTDTQSQLPPRIDFVLHNFCNLTCIYCGPIFSSSWTKEIKENGEYKVGKTISIKDIVKTNLSFVDFDKSTSFNILKQLVEHNDFVNVKTITLLGGEPLINPHLLDVVNIILDNNPTVKLYITTGLGVSDRTFYATIEKLKQLDKRNQININVSAETTGEIFEFIRSGIKWDDFQSKLKHLVTSFTPDRISIMMVLFILGLPDYKNFLLYIKGLGLDPKLVQFGYLEDPPYLSLLSFDSSITKPYIDELLATDLLSDELRRTLISTLATQVSDTTLNAQFINYITEFADRRNLDINIFPENYLKINT